MTSKTITTHELQIARCVQEWEDPSKPDAEPTDEPTLTELLQLLTGAKQSLKITQAQIAAIEASLAGRLP